MSTSSDKPVGKTRDVGYQVGARRTLPVGRERAWQLVTGRDGLRVWLGDIPSTALKPGAAYSLPDGTTGEFRVVTGSHLRLTWHPPGWPRPSTLQVRVLAKDDRSTIAFHQEHLPGAEEREQRRRFFKQALATLEEMS